MELDDRLRFSVGSVCWVLLMNCGSGAKIQSAPNFEAKSLKGQVVLVLPIAVTDDFGDERTGIVLDHESREQATKLACNSAAEMRDDVNLMCFDRPELAKSAPLLNELLLEYARDKAISAERWHELERRTGASFVLLFRPEAVSASQKVSKARPDFPVRGSMIGTSITGLSIPIPVVIPTPEGVGPKVDSVKTSRTYTLASSLVDVRAGTTVRTGVQSAEASTSTGEAPDASRQLYGIMRDLMKGLLRR
jgi:hypothetical protein